MKESSRIKFNPLTKDIEIEGSEKFVKTYFDKIQKMLSASPQVPSIEAPVKEKAAKKERPAKKALPAAGKKTLAKKAKKTSNADKVLTLIRESVEGLNTADLEEKTGLTDKQIWAIVNIAKKQGKIRKEKRCVYVAA